MKEPASFLTRTVADLIGTLKIRNNGHSSTVSIEGVSIALLHLKGPRGYRNYNGLEGRLVFGKIPALLF